MSLKKRVKKYLSNHKSDITISEFVSMVLEKSAKATKIFNEGVQDFGKSMDMMTKELGSDIEKSNKKAKSEAKKNQKNIDKIWGKKK